MVHIVVTGCVGTWDLIMAVRFILGPSGCGKTTYCVNSIVRALADGGGGEDLLLLVPEQATYQAERAILGDERIAGYSRLNVLSFDRLEFLLMGAGAGRAQITRLGQEMIIHRILRTIGEKLNIFASAARTPGLAARLTGVIVELHECALTSADIRELADNLKQARPGSLTAMKFADIAEVFESYIEFIGSAENEFINPDIQLTYACDKVKDADFLRGARIWVDGFSGFTVQQQQLLAQLLKVTSESHIALCLDPAAIDVRGPDAKMLDPLSLFGETERTYADLFEMVRQCKVEIAEPVVLAEPMRFSGSKDLRHVQKNLFASRLAPPISASGDIQILAAANRRAEAGYVAKEILRLVRDRGYRFRDIAVIASDISGYQHYIEATFADYGIPLFIDRPRPLTGHPVVELIGSAIAAVANNFSSADIFACLKTGLMPAGQDEIDVLENYCLAFGIDHGDWVSDDDWSFDPEKDKRYDEKRVSEIRRRVIAPLLELHRLASGEENDKLIGAGAFVGGIWGFLEELNIREELSRWVEQNPSEDNEHLQFYDKLVSVFDELVDIFAGESMRLAEYAQVLNSAFSQLTLAFIPPKLDQVLVGSIERSRHPNLKAVFLIGSTQKHFPVPVSFDSILTDDDREAAEAGDVTLSGRTDQQLAQRQYLAYIAFTRPSERLYITWPASDDGSAAQPSQFINNLRSCFVDLAAVTQDLPGVRDGGNFEDVFSHAELTDMLCQSAAKEGFAEIARELAGNLCGDADARLREIGESAKYAFGYRNEAALDERMAGRLTGTVLNCSASRLASFGACPYQYFARYTLGLQKRRIFGFEPMDVGNFYHRVLDGLFKRLKAQGKDLATADERQLHKLCRERISELLKSDAFLSNFRGRSPHNAFILDSAGEVLEDCVSELAEMTRAGGFRQVGSEVWFGTDDTNMTCGFMTDAGQRINLRGCVDRVDLACIDGSNVGLVFDYKRRGRSVSWPMLFYGMDMQLAVYLLAVVEMKIDGKKIDSVAGAFFVPVEVAPGKGAIGDLQSAKAKFGRKARGIFDGSFAGALDESGALKSNRYYNFRTGKDGPYGDYNRSGAVTPKDFEGLLGFVRSKVVELGSDIFSGKIDITPYRLGNKSPCGFCDYRAVCKFDWQINSYNLLESVDKPAFFGPMGGEDGD